MADGSSRYLDFGQELVVDLFAGGGGASLGISRAYRAPDVAVNHNAIAIAVHEANHPETQHFVADVFEVDPIAATGGRPVALLWASPDCRHHSKAKGGKPRSKKIRGLAWVVIRWASACKPRVIRLENVEEFEDWGPLRGDGSPDPNKKGLTFRRWKKQLEALGYVVEHRQLVAADYGAPTIRKRLYIIARCDGRPITWPAPTHGKPNSVGVRNGTLKPWRMAAECIDFTLPARSIFDRKKPLAANTQRRIAKGLWKYVLTAAEPFIVGCGGRMGQSPERGMAQPFQTVTSKADACVASPVLIEAAHSDVSPTGVRRWGSGVKDIDAPLGTVLAGGGNFALLAAHLTECANGSTQRNFAADEPLRTQCAQVKGGHFALTAATLVQTGYGEREGQQPRALDIAAPLGTVVAGGVKHAVVSAHITKFRANSVGSAIDEPLHTVTAGGDMKRPAGAAHAMGLVSAFLEQANGGFYVGEGRSIDAPVSTICTSGANQRLVSAYLVKYYGTARDGVGLSVPLHTLPTKDRMGLVHVVQVPADTLEPALRERAKRCADLLREFLPEHFTEPADMILVGDRVLADITLRMLVPRELARGQGFPDNYVIEVGADGRKITKTDQVRLIGNSVCPDVAEALIRCDLRDLIDLYARAAA